MQNETDVANLALAMVGKPSIVNLTENTPTAAVLRQNIATARRAQMSRSDWIFARARATLTQIATPGLYEDWRVFALPGDLLKVRAVSNADGVPYHRGRWQGPEARHDGARISIAGESGVVSYTRDVTDVSLWPPLFAESVAYKLASTVAVSLIGRARNASELMALAEATLLRAIETDAAQERSTYARGDDLPLGPLVQDWPIVPAHQHGTLPPGTEVIFTPGPPAEPPAPTDYVALYEAAQS